ncbi:MAG: hypothetical protein M1827_006284 [Pycnora praestabilis]|nr:MAG: hypothetical protein M1827_006284 [Pycnora praestabilis]
MPTSRKIKTQNPSITNTIKHWLSYGPPFSSVRPTNREQCRQLRMAADYFEYYLRTPEAILFSNVELASLSFFQIDGEKVTIRAEYKVEKNARAMFDGVDRSGVGKPLL